MGFLQKLTSENKLVFSDVRNINFVTYNREKTGSFLHVPFGFDRMVHIDLEPQALCNLYKGIFIKTVCTRRNEQEDNSAFYKFHAWLNTVNIIFMKSNDIFHNCSDVKFYDGTTIIVCFETNQIIREMSQLKKTTKEKQSEKQNRR